VSTFSGQGLVTGASCLVGANLVRALLAQGRQVRALVRSDRRALEGLDVEPFVADILDVEALTRATVGVDVVYHLAGSISIEMGGGAEVRDVNVVGTRNVVRACLGTAVRRLVHFSSIEALRHEPLDRPVDESRPLVDESLPIAQAALLPPYERTKAQGEREVLAGLARGLNAVIINPTAILGPCDFKPSYLGEALLLLARGHIPALVSGGFDWVDVRDVVAGALQAEALAPRGARYLLGGTWHTLREVADLVAAETGRPAPRLSVPLGLADAFAPVMLRVARFSGGRPIYTRAMIRTLRGKRLVSHARAADELGYTARPLAESIRDALAWFRDNGYLNGVAQ